MTPHELVAMITGRATEIYAEGDATTCHMPMAFFELQPGQLAILAFADFGDEASKDALRATFEAAAAGGAGCVGMIHEAWTARATTPRSPSGRIADLAPDDRTEMLVIHAAGPAGQHFAHFTIRRGRDKATLEPLVIQGVTVKSRWFDDLPWPRTVGTAVDSPRHVDGYTV
jgi:hypothetical protein